MLGVALTSELFNQASVKVQWHTWGGYLAQPKSLTTSLTRRPGSPRPGNQSCLACHGHLHSSSNVTPVQRLRHNVSFLQWVHIQRMHRCPAHAFLPKSNPSQTNNYFMSQSYSLITYCDMLCPISCAIPSLMIRGPCMPIGSLAIWSRTSCCLTVSGKAFIIVALPFSPIVLRWCATVVSLNEICWHVAPLH